MWQYRAICCNIYTKKESLFRLSCDPVGIRTQDPQLRRLLLYPAELPDQHVSAVGNRCGSFATAKLIKISDITIPGA